MERKSVTFDRANKSLAERKSNIFQVLFVPHVIACIEIVENWTDEKRLTSASDRRK